MKIHLFLQRRTNIVLQWILLITLAQSSLAGMEILYDGKKFFYRFNGRGIPIKLSQGAELVRCNDESVSQFTRKVRDTYHDKKPGLHESNTEGEVDPWSSDSFTVLSEFFDYPEEMNENEAAKYFLRKKKERKPQHTRYEIIAR